LHNIQNCSLSGTDIFSECLAQYILIFLLPRGKNSRNTPVQVTGKIVDLESK